MNSPENSPAPPAHSTTSYTPRKGDWIAYESIVCRNFPCRRLGAKLFLLLLLRKIRDFSRKKVRYKELEEGMSLLYRALDEESQLLAKIYNEEHTLSWKQAIMVAYEEGKPVSFRDLAHFLDESIAVLEALYWKKKALQ
eukprot:g15346.t1